MNQMKKVMGADANKQCKPDGAGGSIMKLGKYSASEKSGGAKKVSYSYSNPANPDQQAGA